MNIQTMDNENIENKHWDGIEKTTGLTKEQFQKMLTIEEEIREFMEELEEWMSASKRIPSKLNFDPMLFSIWRLMKK